MVDATFLKRSFSGIIVLGLALAGCMPAAAPPPPIAAYQPSWTYAPPAKGPKLDVTLGIVAPQFKAGTEMYRDHFKDDETVKAMLRAMNASFNEVLVAKGFNTTGPFDSLNDMTFPDKKGADLLLYPEFDFQVELKTQNVQQGPPPSGGGNGFNLGNLLHTDNSAKTAPAASPNGASSTCDVVVSVSGDISFVAQEALSGERMWVKKHDVKPASETISGQQGTVCSSGPMSIEVTNAWKHAHEAIFQESMKAFDTYVNGEEFQTLKKQSLDIRNRKTY
jgi:hypothetical protein